MKYSQNYSFIPRSITFETEEEWRLFNVLINSAEISQCHPDYNDVEDLTYAIFTMIKDGLVNTN